MRRGLSTRRAVCLAVGPLAFLPGVAGAQADQSTPANRTAPDQARPDHTITVTGHRDTVQTSIDRRSYDVTRDLLATSGSIADALRNVPSVDVDLQGNVSLRGDPNVTIMIDGKPSGTFRGPGGAQALQALPASQIERIEVITNPSAAFAADGSAGIINLVTKRTRTNGLSGSVNARRGTRGRGTIGGSSSWKSGKLTLSADASLRRDPQYSKTIDQRSSLDPVSGDRISAHDEVVGNGAIQLWNTRAGADYDVDSRTRLSAEIRYNSFDYFFDNAEQRIISDPLAGADRIIDRAGRFGSTRHDSQGSATLRRSLPGNGHELTVNVTRERIDATRTQDYLYAYPAPPLPGSFASTLADDADTRTELKADYSRPMPGKAKLQLGYDLQIDDDLHRNSGSTGPTQALAAPDPAQNDLFGFEQTINAFYLTYERPIGKWTILPGLRLEEVNLDLRQHLTGSNFESDTFSAYPSLHIGYAPNADQQISLSYSRRVQRPTAQDLDPFRVSEDPFNLKMGNPALKPQITDSFEAGYQYKSGGTYYLATLYYRHSSKGITDVTTSLGSDVLLTTKENLSSSRNLGLELVATGHITSRLTYNISGNAYWTAIDSLVPGFVARRSALTASGKGNLTWQPAKRDLLQLNASRTGRKLLPQGYQEPMLLVNIGYRHKLTEKLGVLVTAQDALATYKARTVINTIALQDRSIDSGHTQAAFIGLIYAFGPRATKDPGFGFGG